MGKLTSEQRELIRQARSKRERERFAAVIFVERALARRHGLPVPFGGQRRWFMSEGWDGHVASVRRHEDGTRVQTQVREMKEDMPWTVIW